MSDDQLHKLELEIKSLEKDYVVLLDKQKEISADIKNINNNLDGIKKEIFNHDYSVRTLEKGYEEQKKSIKILEQSDLLLVTTVKNVKYLGATFVSVIAIWNVIRSYFGL